MTTLPWLLLILPLASALLIHLALRRMAGTAALLGTASVAATFIINLVLLGKVGSDAFQNLKPLHWIDTGDFQISFSLIPDKLALGMMFVVTTIGLLVHIFSLGYMKDDEGKSRYFAGLSLFMFSMTGIVLADNFLMMFVFWELVGVSSYILIGHWFTKNAAADAAGTAGGGWDGGTAAWRRRREPRPQHPTGTARPRCDYATQQWRTTTKLMVDRRPGH